MRGERDDRLARLHQVLLESEDAGQRAEAHLELGRMSLEGRRVDRAIRHFREALVLDPRLDPARHALHRMGVPDTAVRVASLPGVRWLGSAFRRVLRGGGNSGRS